METVSAKCVWEKHAQVFRYSSAPKDQIAREKWHCGLDKQEAISVAPDGRQLQHCTLGNNKTPFV